MEFIISLSVIVIGLIALGLAALAWGVDSREALRDDHAI